MIVAELAVLMTQITAVSVIVMAVFQIIGTTSE